MKSLKDLQKIKDEVLKDINLREKDPENIQVEVGMGTCGIASGARNIMDALLDELNKRNLSKVRVIQTGCIGMCAEEPLVIVKKPGEEPVVYGNLDEAKTRQIVAQHIVNGMVVDAWAIKE